MLVFSLTAGVMYSTLFAMPYLLVAHYHETDTVSQQCCPTLSDNTCLQIQCEDSWFLKQIRKLLLSIKDGKAEDEVGMKDVKLLNTFYLFQKSKEAGGNTVPYSDQVRTI